MNKNRRTSASIIAIFSGLLAVFLPLVITSEAPLQTLLDFFNRSFFLPGAFSSFLLLTSMLVLAASGSAAALQAGTLNLGGESQIYAASFTTAICLQAMQNFPTFFAVSLAAVIAFFTAGISGLFCALLKTERNVSEVLSSLLLSALLIPLVDYASARLSIPPTAGKTSFFFLTVSLCAVLLLPIALHFFFYHTTKGYRYRMCGLAPEFASYSGFSTKRVTIIGLFFSGGIHGLAGCFAVLGGHAVSQSGFFRGMGWSALAIALIAQSKPAALLPISLVMAFFITAAKGTDTLLFMQGAIFLIVSGTYFSKVRKKERL